MELRTLRYFLEIALTEHRTRSARSLFVTQSTLSHGLRELEEELGVKLFDRIGRGFKLSQAGEAFRVYAARTLREIDAGRMALAEMAGLQPGTLTVGVIPTFLNNLVPATIAAFRVAYPKVKVVIRNLHAGPIEELLIGGHLDVGIAFHPTERDEIDAEPLFEERLLLVVARTHPPSGRHSIGMKSIAGVALALLPRTYSTRRLLDECFREAGVAPLVRVEIESVEALMGACRSGDLATIVPERAARQATDLQSVRLTAPQPVRRAGVLCRKGASRGAARRP